MLKRIYVYLKEMYPVIPRLFLGFLLFFEIYFLVILTNDIYNLKVGIQEIVGSITLFLFLLILRVADDFKDYETDLRLFPHRAFPSGKVLHNDLKRLLIVVVTTMVTLNIIFMNNLLYFLLLFVYGTLMSLWFFNKSKIQKNLPLALITHNPVQILINLYIISFTCIKYNLPILTFNNIVILCTLYFPGLIWEIARKIRAPKDETEYTTYSKLFGFKKATKFILYVMLFDMFTSSFLVYQLYPIAIITVIVSYLWLVYKCTEFMKDPTKFTLVSKVILYEYVTEGTMLLIEILYILNRWYL